jgi:mono/diheme cytochrome c family protein
MLKPLLFVSALILFGVTTSSTPGLTTQENGSAPAAGAKSQGKTGAATMTRAKQIYAVDCLICHGENGNGKTDLAKDMSLSLADWTDAKSLAGKSDEDLFKIIRNGKDKMPPEAEGRAKDEEVRSLIHYIRGMAKDQPAAAPTPAAEPAPAPTPAPGPTN